MTVPLENVESKKMMLVHSINSYKEINMTFHGCGCGQG